MFGAGDGNSERLVRNMLKCLFFLKQTIDMLG